MVPEKRKLMVVGAAIAAAFAMRPVAPRPVTTRPTTGRREPAANAVDADRESHGHPGCRDRGRRRGAEGSTGDSGADAPELSEDEVTSELNAVDVKRMGKTVQNQDGYVLYRFDSDKSSRRSSPTATATARRSGRRSSPTARSPSSRASTRTDVGFVTRKDGTKQLTVGKLAGLHLHR